MQYILFIVDNKMMQFSIVKCYLSQYQTSLKTKSESYMDM